MSAKNEGKGNHDNNKNRFTVTQEGSATWVRPQGNPDLRINTSTPGAPYNTEPSLKWKCEDVGVEMDKFIDLLAKDRSDMEIAGELGIDREVAAKLKEEFFKYGINSVVGKD